MHALRHLLLLLLLLLLQLLRALQHKHSYQLLITIIN
jgi:hypothetical protein